MSGALLLLSCLLLLTNILTAIWVYRVRESRKTIEYDLRHGGEIQRTLMAHYTSVPDYEIEIINMPYRNWLGGDGYSLVTSDHHWLRVSDAAGHGAVGGQAEILDQMLFRKMVSKAANSLFAIRLLNNWHRDNELGLSYAYFIANILPEGMVNYVNARQYAWHVGDKVTPLRQQLFTIGTGEISDVMEIQFLKLKVGESLLVSTDGLIESHYYSSELRRKRFVGAEFVKGHARKHPASIFAIAKQLPGFAAHDDILMVKLTRLQ